MRPGRTPGLLNNDKVDRFCRQTPGLAAVLSTPADRNDMTAARRLDLILNPGPARTTSDDQQVATL